MLIRNCWWMLANIYKSINLSSYFEVPHLEPHWFGKLGPEVVKDWTWPWAIEVCGVLVSLWYGPIAIIIITIIIIIITIIIIVIIITIAIEKPHHIYIYIQILFLWSAANHRLFGRVLSARTNRYILPPWSFINQISKHPWFLWQVSTQKKSQCDRCFNVPFTMDVCCLTLHCWIYVLGGIVVHVHVVGSMCTIIVNILSPHPSIRMDSVSKISPDFCFRFRCYSHMVWFQLQLV